MGREARLPFRRLALFALPAIPAAAISFPIGAYLPPFYAAATGMDLATLGAVFMLARLGDLLIDPAMGALSDRTRSRWGRRKPWLAAGAPILMVGAWLLFFPPADAGIGWLAGALAVVYLGYTMLTITQYAWAADLSDDYHERSRLQGAVVIASIAGLLSAMLLPALVEGSAADPLTARVEAIGWYALVLTLPAVMLACAAVPAGTAEGGVEASLLDATRRLLRRPEFVRLLLADFIQGVAGGLLLSGFLFTAASYWKLGDRSALLLLVFMASGVVCVPIWLRFARTMAKNSATALASATTIPFIVALFFVPPGNLLLVALLMVGFGSTMGVWIFLTRSMVADLDELEFRASGRRQAGTAFALVTLSTKLGGALAVGLSFWVFQMIGFDARTPGATAPDIALGIATVTLGGPILGHLAVIALMRFHPDDRARLAATAS
ncbi:MAG TPA: MFS transporter [Sphingomonadaceae bacterium]|nr:MFS transporter [Sphingomonadaceae bacterium]